MSVAKLEKIFDDYYNKSQSALNIGKFMLMIIDTLKDQSDEIANLRQELAKKEDVIDVNNIKEVRNLNGN